MRPHASLALILLLTPACNGDGDGNASDGTDGGTESGSAGSTSTSGGASSGTSQGTASGGSGGSSTSTSAGSDSATTGGCAQVPTFETDIIPIFEMGCGTADGDCHWRGAYGAQVNSDCRGWLTLENSSLGAEFYAGPDMGVATGCPDRTLFERLLDLDAWNCEQYDARKRYVIPCDPEGSYLFNKINGSPLCNLDKDGQTNVPSWPMPPPADELENAYMISDAQKQMIYEWIAAGAPRDGEECEMLCEGDTGGSTGGGSTGGGVGGVPEVQINHPGNGEQRKVNQNVPLIGVANDAEDGALGGAAMVWNSSVEGDVATGAQADWVPTQTGFHVLKLTATDSDQNEGSDMIEIEVIP